MPKLTCHPLPSSPSIQIPQFSFSRQEHRIRQIPPNAPHINSPVTKEAAILLDELRVMLIFTCSMFEPINNKGPIIPNWTTSIEDALMTLADTVELDDPTVPKSI